MDYRETIDSLENCEVEEVIKESDCIGKWLLKALEKKGYKEHKYYKMLEQELKITGVMQHKRVLELPNGVQIQRLYVVQKAIKEKEKARYSKAHHRGLICYQGELLNTIEYTWELPRLAQYLRNWSFLRKMNRTKFSFSFVEKDPILEELGKLEEIVGANSDIFSRHRTAFYITTKRAFEDLRKGGIKNEDKTIIMTDFSRDCDQIAFDLLTHFILPYYPFVCNKRVADIIIDYTKQLLLNATQDMKNKRDNYVNKPLPQKEIEKMDAILEEKTKALNTDGMSEEQIDEARGEIYREIVNMENELKKKYVNPEELERIEREIEEFISTRPKYKISLQDKNLNIKIE